MAYRSGCENPLTNSECLAFKCGVSLYLDRCVLQRSQLSHIQANRPEGAHKSVHVDVDDGLSQIPSRLNFHKLQLDQHSSSLPKPTATHYSLSVRLQPINLGHLHQFVPLHPIIRPSVGTYHLSPSPLLETRQSSSRALHPS